MWQQYEKDHAKYPERIMVGTESLPKEAFESWQQVEQHPWVIGDFVWTAMDYMGEVAIGHTELDTIRSHTQPWPWYNAYCGDIDLIGGKKPQSWYRDVVWRQRKMAMLVHAPIPEGHKEAITKWGWPDEYPSWNFAGHESKPLQVNVYTRYSLVRLVLNGKTIGEKPASENTKLTAAFTVNYYPGVLKAVGIQDGRIMDSVVLYTTGAPKTIRLTADRKIIRANRNDVSYVTVEVLDANGLVVPDGVVPVYFSIAGQGEIAATGNANPSDMASFQKPERNTFRGRCLVIVRPKGTAGKITLKAEAGNLVKGELDITVK
jgi:beta-galactosidase